MLGLINYGPRTSYSKKIYFDRCGAGVYELVLLISDPGL